MTEIINKIIGGEDIENIFGYTLYRLFKHGPILVWTPINRTFLQTVKYT